MPRKNRLVYPNAWYHVFNRSTARKTIFLSQSYYDYFLGLLDHIHLQYKIEIHAYCLMKNHYHLLIKTPEANISEAMWYFGSKLGRFVNQLIGSDGPVFRSRYQCVVVENSAHLLNVSRYIHLNPVDANIVAKPQNYEWSSFRTYATPERRDSKCLQTDFLLGHFMKNREYVEYVNLGIDGPTQKFYQKQRLPQIITLS